MARLYSTLCERKNNHKMHEKHEKMFSLVILNEREESHDNSIDN